MINSAFAICPVNQNVGSFYVGPVPVLICIDYLSSKCMAKCGQSTGGTCAEVNGKWGPFGLTGESCEDTSGGGTVDCTLTPYDPSCTSGGGTVDCTVTPNDPPCTSGGDDEVSCTEDPNQFKCQTPSAAVGDGISYYQDSNGKWRTIYISTGLKDTIITSAKAVQTSVENVGRDIANSNPAPLLSSIDLKLASLSTTNSLLQTVDNSINYLSDKLENGASGSSPTAIDYSSKLDALIDLSSYQTNFLGSIQGGFYSLSDHSARISSNTGALFNSYKFYSEIQTKQLDDIKALLAQAVSGGSGTGSGGGDGEGSGPSVGTAENPAHLASSLYKPCSDCIVDMDGAKAELEASKEKLKALNKAIQTEFKDIFTFDSASGSGSSAIASCWDFGSLIGQKCMQLDETWAVLKALVLFIFMIAIVFMFMRGD